MKIKRASGKSLKDRVVESLREDILKCRLKPGIALVERDLADRFHVSKTPVREALTVLVHEGLVRVLPRKGYFISPITVQDVHEYFNLRMILECAAAEQAAAKLTDEQLHRLERLSSPQNPVEDTQAMLDRNVAFHSLIAHASQNERLAQLIEKFLGEMKRLITVGYVPAAHGRLMAALRERDPVQAKEAMREHILVVRDNALRGAMSTGGSSPVDATGPVAMDRNLNTRSSEGSQ